MAAQVGRRVHLDAVLACHRRSAPARGCGCRPAPADRRVLLEDARHRARVRIRVALVLRVHVRVRVEMQHAEPPPALRHRAHRRVADGVIAAEQQQPRRDRRAPVRRPARSHRSAPARRARLRTLQVAVIDDRVARPDPHARSLYALPASEPSARRMAAGARAGPRRKLEFASNGMPSTPTARRDAAHRSADRGASAGAARAARLRESAATVERQAARRERQRQQERLRGRRRRTRTPYRSRRRGRTTTRTGTRATLAPPDHDQGQRAAEVQRQVGGRDDDREESESLDQRLAVVHQRECAGQHAGYAPARRLAPRTGCSVRPAPAGRRSWPACGSARRPAWSSRSGNRAR